MTMAEVYLEARNPDKGCMRAYRVTLMRDLFGAFMVEARYGRIGSYGHTLTYSFDDEEAARTFMDKCLRRRKSAPKRIGTAYVVQNAPLQ